MPPLNGRWISIYRRDVLSLSVVGVKPFGKAAILAWVSITVPLMQGIICSSDLNRCLLLYCTVGSLCMSLLFCVCWVWYYTYSVEYYSFTYAMLLVCSVVPCPAVSRIFYGIWMLHSLRIFLSFCKYVALRV